MGCVGILCPDAWAVDIEELFVRDTIELCKEAGFPLMYFEGVPYVSPELERLVALVRADERAAPVQEPVAYLCENAVGHKYFRWKKPSSEFKPIALYTTPPAQPAPVQPMAHIVGEIDHAGKVWKPN
jgi:hypothetical protein